MEDAQIAQHDLSILEEMVAELPEYLLSDATHWNMVQADMPKLTIGGCLMRQQRLKVVRKLLSSEDQARLNDILQRLNKILNDNIVRIETRTHQELHARLSQWAGYLARMKSETLSQPEYYASVVDTRVVIASMITLLSSPPYQLAEQVLRETDALDGNLRNHWQEGPFVWPEVWQPAYPRQMYWYLYGRPH